ncbi:MAG: tail fiber domain-containing protein [Patescibacteria group bacterium]
MRRLFIGILAFSMLIFAFFNTNVILDLLITPLPKDLQGCLSAKFSNDVNAQNVCTGVSGGTVAVWDEADAGSIRDSRILEDYGSDLSGASKGRLTIQNSEGIRLENNLAGQNQKYGFMFSENNIHVGSNTYWDGNWKKISAGSSARFQTNLDSDNAFQIFADTADRTANALTEDTSIFVVDMNGDVGIQDDTPTYDLDVDGRVGINVTDGYGALLNIGSIGTNYPGDSGWTTNYNANILLNGYNSTSIGFHDSGHSLATLRYTENMFYLGEDLGWNSSGLSVGGGVVAPNYTVSGHATIGPSTASWTPLNISGNKGGYAGFNFTNEGVRLMMDSTHQGVHNDTVGWLWYFSNGTLTTGSIPWGRIPTSTMPSFVRNAQNERVRAYDVGCNSGYATPCDSDSDGIIDNAEYSTYLHSTTHSGTYYLYNSWTGSHWLLRSNHGSPVRVGYADSAGSATTASSVTTTSSGYGQLIMAANGIYRNGGSVFELQYNGGGAVRIGGGQTANLVVNGTINGQSISDERLKSQIANIEDPLSFISRFDGKTYLWRDPQWIKDRYSLDNSDGVHYGFIAQDIEEVMPDWVKTNQDGFKVIKQDYDTINGMFALLVESVKELIARITGIEQEVAELEKKIEEQKSDIKILEKRLDQLEEMQ